MSVQNIINVMFKMIKKSMKLKNKFKIKKIE